MQPYHEMASTNSKASAFVDRLTSHIPQLQTERLVLRAPKISDFAAYAEIVLSPKGRFIVSNQSREHAWYDFANLLACWLLRGHGIWTVDRTKDDAVVGFVLIGFEPGDHEPELGYMVTGQSEGFGYATEAAQTAMRYAFEQLGFTTLVSTIDQGNHGSIKVAQKLGGVRDPRAEFEHDNEILVFRYTPASM